MDAGLLQQLSRVTQEEQNILGGQTVIDRELYMQGSPDVINSRKLLAAGKLITLRPHTRFIHFPKHTHDYVEMVYMCTGFTTHIVNGQRITLRQGELLLLNQSATHEVCRAEAGDVAVNFIILPDFFAATLADLGELESPLRRFIVDCLCGRNNGPGYLHFQVSGVQPIQNLAENLLWVLLHESSTKRKESQLTMSLLFLHLIDHTKMLSVPTREEAAVFKLLDYVETKYAGGSLTEAARQLHYDLAWLSREVKRKTGKTYTQLVQEKRLAQAAFLLKNTGRNVADISAAVGYENVSYFHRLFYAAYGTSPKHYRDRL